MQKWKYRTMILRDLSIAESKLTAEGEKGWELVSVCIMDSNTARAFFKMPTSELDATEAQFSGDAGLGGQSPF